MAKIEPELYRIPIEIPAYPDIKYIYFIWPNINTKNINGKFSNCSELPNTKATRMFRQATYFIDQGDQDENLAIKLLSAGFENIHVINSNTYGILNGQRVSPLKSWFNFMASTNGTSQAVICPAMVISDAIAEKYPSYHSFWDRTNSYTGMLNTRAYVRARTHSLFGIRLASTDDTPTSQISALKICQVGWYYDTSNIVYHEDITYSKRLTVNSYNDWGTINASVASVGVYYQEVPNRDMIIQSQTAYIKLTTILLPNSRGLVSTPLSFDTIECVTAEKPKLNTFNDGLYACFVHIVGGQIIFNGDRDLPGLHVDGNVVLQVGTGYVNDYDDLISPQTCVIINGVNGSFNYDILKPNNEIVNSTKLSFYNSSHHYLMAPVFFVYGNLVIHNGEIIYSSRIPYDWNFSD